MSEYTVIAVNPRVRDWDSQKGGKMKSYRLDVDGPQGKIANVELAQREATPAPKPGDKIDGDIDMEAPYGPKLKKTQQQRGGGGWRAKSPEELQADRERQAAITRQGCQRNAIMALAVGGQVPTAEGIIELTERLFVDATAARLLATPGPSGSREFGPEFPGDLGKVRYALSHLTGDDGAAGEVYDFLVRDCGGYLPAKVARALLATSARAKAQADLLAAA